MRFRVRSNKRLAEQLVILCMRSDPEPDRAFGSVDGQRSVVRAHAGRPKTPDFLEADRWILRILLDMAICLVRQPADVFR